MDQQYRERNIKDCEKKIASVDARLDKVKETGENIKDLKERRKGYVEKLEEFLDQ